MFPSPLARINKDIPDETPESTVTNCAPELIEITPEFVAVKVEVKIEEATSSPDTSNIKQEPVDSVLENIKTEPPEDDDSYTFQVQVEPADVPPVFNYQFQNPLQQQALQTYMALQNEYNKLSSQTQTVSNTPEKPYININGSYKCVKCSRILKNRHSFSAHKSRGCTPKPDLHCYSCGHTFTKIFNYKAHMQTHSKYIHEGDFSILEIKEPNTSKEGYTACPVCKEEFLHLKPHLKVHISKHPPYKCPICQKNFTLKHNAQKHLLIHRREKVLTCSICNKTFPRESRLRYHLNSHVKVKLFSCDVCGRRLSHKSNIIRHIVRKHPGLIKEGMYGPYK